MGVMLGFFFYLVPIYIRESVPHQIGGFYGSFHQLLIVIGIGLAYSLSLFLPMGQDLLLGKYICWRQILLVPIIISTIQILMFMLVFKNDTPKSLLLTGWTDQCTVALKKIYKNESDIQKEIEGYQEERENQTNADFWKILASTKKILAVCLFLAIFQQLSGCSSLTYFSTQIFKEVLQSQRLASIGTVVLGLIQIVITSLSLLIVDRLGRRPLLIFGSAFCGISLALCGYFYNPNASQLHIWRQYSCIGAIALFNIAFSIAQGPVTWTYIGEAIHLKTMPLVVAANFVTCLLTVSWTLPLIVAIKQWFFYMYAMCMVVYLIVAIMFVKETKGLTDKEILTMYSSSCSGVTESEKCVSLVDKGK